jgi:hypothetical protein
MGGRRGPLSRHRADGCAVRAPLVCALVLCVAAAPAPALAETVTVVPGSVTVQMTPLEFRGHRVDRGTAVTVPEVRAVQGVHVLQAGVGNTATVQTGAGNTAVVVQQGTSLSASVTQTGTAQGALVIQTGTGGGVAVVQEVDADRVVIVQHSWEPRR